MRLYRFLFLALLLSFSLALFLAAAPAGTRPDAGQNIWVGKWLGTIEDRPAVMIRLKADGGGLSGSSVFYLLFDDGNSLEPAAKRELPLIEPRASGKTLSFRVRNLDNKELPFEMKLIAGNQAELRFVGASGGDDEEALRIKLTREK